MDKFQTVKKSIEEDTSHEEEKKKTTTTIAETLTFRPSSFRFIVRHGNISKLSIK